MGQHEHDPHAQVHELATGEHEDHDEALADSAGDETIEEKLAKLDKRLTGRINDLRKDFDTTKKAISKSVSDFQNAINDLKTATENNKASIEAQDQSIENAATKATAAKAAADQTAVKAGQVETALNALDTEYRAHIHPMRITLSGETDPPAEGGGPA